MSAILYAPLILAGIVLLLFGGDFLVRGGAALANRWKLPPLLVGLTIIAFGTSAPELVVSIQSALSGAPGLAVGNIVGSNIANFLLVLGLPALFGTIHTTTKGLRRNALFALAAAIALLGFGWDRQISTTESWILLGAIVGYVALLGFQARKSTDDPTLAELTDIEHIDGLPKTMPSIIFALIAGLVALPVGAQMVVTGGMAAAQGLGVDPALVGLTAVALGTSLPELATVLMASVRRQADLAIGNVLGSNIFNIFAVGGATGLASAAIGTQLNVPEHFFSLDLWVMLGASVLIAGIVLLQRPITRLLGAVLTIAYLAYIGFLALPLLG
jgi:cation:H+ antiporter